ncbi:MAG: hypothetical protein DMG57_37020 [Acidobacteria bacterium]|nr:MAG: hypothetical protein DMG57_37020 [Acidobacteriota bacterium]
MIISRTEPKPVFSVRTGFSVSTGLVQGSRLICHNANGERSRGEHQHEGGRPNPFNYIYIGKALDRQSQDTIKQFGIAGMVSKVNPNIR